MRLRIFTDGSCYQAKGSWAYAVVDASTEELITSDAKAFDNATNNRAELLAVINALKLCKENFTSIDDIEIVCDSAYVVNCFKDKWYVKWRRNNWYGASGPVKNRELWEELLSLAESFKPPIQWTHIRGHQGNKWNEFCDEECTRVRRETFG